MNRPNPGQVAESGTDQFRRRCRSRSLGDLRVSVRNAVRGSGVQPIERSLARSGFEIPSLLRCAVGTLLFVSTSVLGASTYQITSLLDGVAADGECRLREAIRAADTDVAVNECAAGTVFDEIVLLATGVYQFGQGEEVLESGFVTIRGAAASAQDFEVDLQGANRFLVLGGPATLTLEDLTLSNGFAPWGGALYFPSGDFLLRNLTVRASRALQKGGGLFVVTTGDGNSPRIEGCSFVDNTAGMADEFGHPRGGGAWLDLATQTQLLILDTSFEGNRAEASGADSTASGAGLFVLVTGDSDVRLAGLRFASNSSLAENAWAAAASVGTNSSATTTMTDSTFEGNASHSIIASTSGAIAQFSVSGPSSTGLELRRFAVIANGSGSPAASQLSVEVAESSRAIIESGTVALSPQGGLRVTAVNDSELLVGQVTVAGNAGAGLTVASTSTIPPRLEGSILWGNLIPLDLVIEAGTADTDRITNHNWIGSLGDPDPLFVDPLNADFSLQGISGAIDAGDASAASVGPFDVRHAPRVVGAEIDLGAFELGGLYADDFESGSAGAWSGSVP